MDTIAAISTAPGRAAVAVVRVSGPEVPVIIERLFGSSLPPREPVLRWLRDPESDDKVDQVLVTHFPAPRSYTGEEMLEISCHGGSLAPQLALSAVHAAGARQAERGEFTRRAYLNGKLDLLQAEAILDIVDGRSAAGHRAALHQLDRGLSRRIEELREALVRCEALLVYEIDFPEEDEGPVSPEAVADAARDVLGRIDRLLETAAQGELVREGALVVIAGRPNAGKSSLFNALCGVERAIVTEEPGTTRDAVEAVVSLDGFPFRLVDTAGLREARGTVERIGIEVARRYLANADVVLFCAEAGRPLTEEERGFIEGVDADSIVLVRTKSDLVDRDAPAGPAPGARDGEVIVSTPKGVGLGQLRDRLVAAVFAGLASSRVETPLVTRERHGRELRRARSEVTDFLAARERRVAPEVAATHLRAAGVALEEMLGVIAPDDLLARVFSEFCIGK
ncbi:MAG: tRNA uridine-5-carboxymethylaminomethyl(34) synthesis GTPase MnmE [Gemmatimonadetes bacterium]|uniref:tRNA modification GTPase MnmE n=1 Tax=Candidatus Kutchimonas denitrificans TaxID=3056748 RepID=A0AAE4ZB13_9BACT|nr:tRNA uridine-5-carboxymethylaminomethyl(34) synthesis GTPase MnmE [Gemmatimonadota bacterium]NIR74125.1 tRNA uridine-5-carboxymethylaminomethyl(34) synthesis GTPase MnmE [Candidatus Kutchimonas denitrificans]NIS01307.1 tRNA uridine-5-carboxymethylaminomethyl(34) synthesis GTPase MnmE [Gemmatimonadota bacterium]NIT67038.1 tRNA uridine-5-carboxymethylaminomethyl(34) synthesis GTPase MnmE [Gemmatimonadota bacterium]NIU51698.1 tRNA uridine-5-carboxymethylaminomethyl(34) synthesis GTPase MnmE [Ge